MADEACDAGLLEGCKADCTGVLTGWSCTGGNETSPTVCVSTCGDGKKVGNETCDNGNMN